MRCSKPSSTKSRRRQRHGRERGRNGRARQGLIDGAWSTRSVSATGEIRSSYDREPLAVVADASAEDVAVVAAAAEPVVGSPSSVCRARARAALRVFRGKSDLARAISEATPVVAGPQSHLSRRWNLELG
jgi:hypothetical protein